jgi:alkyl hydroperoxide reductase subunit AhpF
MSHEYYTVSVKGVLAAGDNHRMGVLDIALNEQNMDDIEEDERPAAKALVEKLRALPKGKHVCTCMTCPVTGDGPMAIGWFHEDRKNDAQEFEEDS